jgi:hypothetical protein
MDEPINDMAYDAYKTANEIVDAYFHVISSEHTAIASAILAAGIMISSVLRENLHKEE